MNINLWRTSFDTQHNICSIILRGRGILLICGQSLTQSAVPVLYMWEGKVFALLLLVIDRLLLQRMLVVRPKGLRLSCLALVAIAQLIGIGRHMCPELGVEAMIQAEPRWFIATTHIECKRWDVECCARFCRSILLWSIRNGRNHRLRWGRLCLGSQDHGSCKEELKAWRRRRGSRWRVGHDK